MERGEMKKKNTSRAAVILAALCTVIWTARVIFDAAHQTYDENTVWFILNASCAAIWIVAFIVNLKRYRSDKKK